MSRRDEAAFEALVARHGPMVLGVCRRMLADPHDVEDAFQATFLVLVRRAGSIRDREVVATWLHEVAVRVARRARLDASRRSDRERRGAVAEARDEDAAPGLEWSEVRARIDEEIGRLPESHRRLVVLCDVEGLSREEAAARLGWTTNMVRGRLERARGRLRDRLTRRGLSPSGAYLGLAMPALAPRAALVVETVRGAMALMVGRAAGPGAAVVLSERVARMMMLAKWKPAATALASACLVATLATVPAAGARPAGVPARVEAKRGDDAPRAKPARRRLIDLEDAPSSGPFLIENPKHDPDGPRPSMDVAPEAVPVRVSGLVRDLDEKPVAGATVLLIATRLRDDPRLKMDTTLVGTTKAGSDGRYSFPAVPIPTSRQIHTPQAATPYVQFRVLAQAPGFGVGWHRGASMYALPLKDPDDIQGRMGLNTPATMDVHLRPEATLRGRVVDEAGKPVSGVEVRVMEVDLLDERGAETTVRSSIDPPPLSGGLGRASTDADGRFRLPGLPSESCCWLRFERPGSSASRWLYASTSAVAETEHPAPAEHNGRGKHVVFPADMTVSLPTTRRLDIRVVASDDGQPVPGIRLNSMSETLATGITAGGTSDAEGKLSLELPAGQYRGLVGTPASPDSRFVRTYLRPFAVAPEPAVQPIEFRMKAGAEVLMEVVDAETGRGIPDVRFDIKPGQRAPDWDRLQKAGTYIGLEAKTDAAGAARAVLDPNPGVAYRVRVSGVGLDRPAVPVDPADAVPPAPPAPGNEVKALPYDPVRAESDPFVPKPGEPVRLRFLLRKK